jgi:glycosyltransferase involved in cell wall biosynthesis
LKRHHGCKLIYDTHELESKAFAVRGVRRLYSERLERALIRHCDAVICVSDGIADWYAAHYGIVRPLVVRNVPDQRSQPPATLPEDLRTRFGIPPESLLFLYQGRLAAGRQVEQLIRVFPCLSSRHHLVFMGHGELEGVVRQAATSHSNIHHHPAVAPKEVLGYTAQADVGLVGVENTCLSYYLSLPNKLFECLVAGVPIAVPRFPEMQQIIDRYECGWSWEGGTAGLVELLKGLTVDEIKSRRYKALTASRELSWEREEPKLLDLYRTLLG